jgi:hypothetical protein
MPAGTKESSNIPQEVVTIEIHNQKPEPYGAVTVFARIGRAEFKNEDDVDYRVLVWRARTEKALAIELLLPAHQTIAFTTQVEEQFHYSVLDRFGNAETGHGGGPIKFEVPEMEVGHGTPPGKGGGNG